MTKQAVKFSDFNYLTGVNENGVPQLNLVEAVEDLPGAFSYALANNSRPEVLTYFNRERVAEPAHGFNLTFINAVKKIASSALKARAEAQAEINKQTGAEVEISTVEETVKLPSVIDNTMKKWAEENKENPKYYETKESFKAASSIYYNKKRMNDLIEQSGVNTIDSNELGSDGKQIYTFSDSDLLILIDQTELIKELAADEAHSDPEWPKSERSVLTSAGWEQYEKRKLEVIDEYVAANGKDSLDKAQWDKCNKLRERVKEGFTYPEGWQIPPKTQNDVDNIPKNLTSQATDLVDNFLKLFTFNVIVADELWNFDEIPA